MGVYLIGEDDVTKEIIRKVVLYCSKDYDDIIELPARGGQLKSDFLKYNKLAENNIVILLMDLDNEDCAPKLIEKLLEGNEKSIKFIVNVAIDEAEAWLMADRISFAKYFDVPLAVIPESKPFSRLRPDIIEIPFSYKSSLYMMKEIIPKSGNQVIKQQLIPVKGAKKGKEYNYAILPFVKNHWQIKEALQNSNSLHRMVTRINKL